MLLANRLELLSAVPIDVASLLDQTLFGETDLLHDVLVSLNSSELARRRFREIACVAGVAFTGYPGQPKSTRQLQASSSLFYEMLAKCDAGNLLLTQAQTEVPSPFELPLMESARSVAEGAPACAARDGSRGPLSCARAARGPRHRAGRSRPAMRRRSPRSPSVPARC